MTIAPPDVAPRVELEIIEKLPQEQVRACFDALAEKINNDPELLETIEERERVDAWFKGRGFDKKSDRAPIKTEEDEKGVRLIYETFQQFGINKEDGIKLHVEFLSFVPGKDNGELVFSRRRRNFNFSHKGKAITTEKLNLGTRFLQDGEKLAGELEAFLDLKTKISS